jgi:coenzyme PQQ precursor peptide PqqA
MAGSRDSDGYPISAAVPANHENREGRFMMIRFPAPRRFGEDGMPDQPSRLARQTTGGLVMKWETPQAIDLRFGMEITMYIAHR